MDYQPPICAECGEPIAMSDQTRMFLGSKGDPEKEPEEPFGFLTHERCGDAFAKRLEAAKSD